MNKTCTKCGVEKPFALFHRNALAKDGLQSRCADCCNEWQRERAKDPLVKRAASARATAWSRANRERTNAARKARDASRPDVTRGRYLRKTYGITLADQKAQLDSQAGACAICLEQIGAGKVCIDHCHETGKPRGVLCQKCNSAIGLLKDRADVVERAAAYLRAGGTWVQSTHSEPMGAKLKQVAA